MASPVDLDCLLLSLDDPGLVSMDTVRDALEELRQARQAVATYAEGSVPGHPEITVDTYIATLMPEGDWDRNVWQAKVERRRDGWAVCRGERWSTCMDIDGNWDREIWEDRPEGWTDRNRFTLAKALELASWSAHNSVLNGMTAPQALEEKVTRAAEREAAEAATKKAAKGPKAKKSAGK